MTERKKTEELNEQDLDQVTGGFSFGAERVVKPAPKTPGTKGWSTSGDADDRPTEE